MRIIILSIINCILMATGQILWKTGVSGYTIKSFPQMIQALFSPFVLLGLVIYAFSMLLWLYILNQADISYVYPIQSLVFIFVLIASVLIFHESIPNTRWLGVFIICVGVYFVSIK